MCTRTMVDGSHIQIHLRKNNKTYFIWHIDVDVAQLTRKKIKFIFNKKKMFYLE